MRPTRVRQLAKQGVDSIEARRGRARGGGPKGKTIGMVVREIFEARA